MRVAELIMAAVMAVFSLYLMWKSAELPIGWLKGAGPGGGAWPFWLAAVMLISCIVIFVRGLLRLSPVAQSRATYMDRRGMTLFAIVGGSLAAMIGLILFVGVYVAVPLFLIFYIRFFGRHSWVTTLSIALLTPPVTFYFFEVVLLKTLPKGITEPLFYPIFDLVY